MTYLLDSNSCIGWLRQNQPKLVARIKQERPTDIVICSVVVGELIYGAERAATAHRVNNRLRIEQLRQQFVSVPFNDSAAEVYGKVRAHLAVLGTPIGPNDLMIAAIALANALILVTNNTSEFSRVPGLRIEDWQ
jgi:tRNA(fMet)-specific endonuclease VapC